mmetsp:Transcript_9734/g.30408  ORF Transcript_9734/g.30408 Transcript_9734/m.30408 type:complete len:99 (+) Transcript_9734:1204-1500(+)
MPPSVDCPLLDPMPTPARPRQCGTEAAQDKPIPRAPQRRSRCWQACLDLAGLAARRGRRLPAAAAADTAAGSSASSRHAEEAAALARPTGHSVWDSGT